MEKVLLIMLAVVVIFTVSCSSNIKDDQYVISTDFNSSSERIEELSKYIKFPSPVEDVEFNLFNVNGFINSRSIPGASSWHYEYAVKIKVEDMQKWLMGFSVRDVEMNQEGWIKTLLNKEGWKVSSPFEVYFNKDKSVSYMVFQNEGIIIVQTGHL
ncbi:MAG: hypothetical protein NT150_11285 [Bacteroidetes bacterium]|nr:hypothetical protein [Bacteroidota bacterium]